MKFFTSIFTLFLIVNYYTSVRAQVQLPLQIEKGGHAFIKVKVNNGEEAFNFVFDTGATSDLIDKNLADKIGLKGNYQQIVSGASGEEIYDIALNQELHLSKDIHIEGVPLIIKDLSNLNSVFGTHIDGIIGYSVISRFVTKIDYENNKLVLYNSLKDADLTGYSKLPFSFDNGIPIPQFNIGFELTNGEKLEGKILFDSGAGLTLLVNTPFSSKHAIKKKASKKVSHLSEGLGSSSTSDIIRIASLTLGEYTFTELPILLSEAKQGVSSKEEFMGILGAKIIQKFHVVLDYENKVLYLKPNGLFNDAFKFPVSGIKLKRDGNKIVVRSVDKNSPAYQLGLRKDFEILAINNSKQDLKSCVELLTEEGKKIVLTFLDENQQEKTIHFSLEKLL